MKGMIAAVLLFVVGLVIALYVHLGGFKSVTLTQTEEGPFKVISKQHIGAYHKIVPVIEEVEKWAKAHGETCHLSFGEYLDNVDTVPEDRLKSNGGCVVEKAWTSGLPEGFEYRELPRRQYIVAEFSGAPSIGPLKVYPKAQKEIKAKGLVLDGPVIEMYEIIPPKGVKTRYYFPVKPNS